MPEFYIPTDIAEIAERLGSAAHGLAGKCVLLTGGRGFLGRYFTQVFTHLNENVLAEPVMWRSACRSSSSQSKQTGRRTL